MRSIAIECDMLVDFILIGVVVITIVKDDGMYKTAEWTMADVVTACDETQ
jgi:hypothetical protein